MDMVGNPVMYRHDPELSTKARRKLLKTDESIQRLVDGYGSWFDDDARLESGRMSSRLYPYDHLFSPIRINRMTVKNRLVMAPMGNISMCEETGRPNTQMIRYFIERAKGGVGLITSGLVPISFGIDHSIIELDKLTYFPRIDRSRTVSQAGGIWLPVFTLRCQILYPADSGTRAGGESAVPDQLVQISSLRLDESQLLYGLVPCMPLERPEAQKNHQKRRAGGRGCQSRPYRRLLSPWA